MVQKSYGPFHKSFFQSSSHHNWPKKVVTFCMKISTPNQQHEAAAMPAGLLCMFLFFSRRQTPSVRSGGALQPQGEHRDKWDGNNDHSRWSGNTINKNLAGKKKNVCWLSIRQNWKWVCGTKHKVLTLNIYVINSTCVNFGRVLGSTCPLFWAYSYI